MAYEHKPDSGTLFKNSYKEEGDNKPDYKGEANVGGELKEIAAWIKDGKNGKFLSLKFSEPYEKATAGVGSTSDDVPF